MKKFAVSVFLEETDVTKFSNNVHVYFKTLDELKEFVKYLEIYKKYCDNEPDSGNEEEETLDNYMRQYLDGTGVGVDNVKDFIEDLNTKNEATENAIELQEFFAPIMECWYVFEKYKFEPCCYTSLDIHGEFYPVGIESYSLYKRKPLKLS